METLRDIPCGQKVTVVKVHGDGALRKRIRDMGMTKGTEVVIKKVAPLGDPIELTIRGYALTIRKEDAGVVEVSTKGE